ncbi:MAG: helicase C-terminal domain-containing protein [Candidatus Promineifilaceae bacterium]|nr:helicase C-terminal domain-containing protein [Candidatus Promineifilaceae bacterium]
MLNTYVAVDIETTGLDSSRDAIIEIAAIVFQGNDIIDEFSSLVYPQRDIPPEITRLTGITQAMVEDAPSMHQVRSQLRPVLSNHVLVGHNVDFDLSFLKEERLGFGNHRLDTVTLASILVPEAGRFGLGALADFLFLPLPDGRQVHRARDDAELTVELFLALREKALQIPLALLDEIVRAGQNIGWPETLFFEEVLAERTKDAFISGELRQRGRLPKLFVPPKLEGRVVVAKEDLGALDIDLIAGMIQPGGNFSQVFDGFEYRAQQEEMLFAVAQAFNDGDHVLIEAGTGTGKSIGYLLPAAFWAVENGRRVVISTNTINLQDQLIQKDIPELQKSLPFELRAAVRKGRSNYLCTRLFQQFRRSGPSSADEMALYARILLWLPTTESADVAELPLRSPAERMTWTRLNGENAVCTQDQCAAEGCPLHQVRQRAEQAHLVIVNHALLLSDVANENHVLPVFLDLIVDEAHHLESAVTNGLSFRADKRFLETILDEISKPRAGLLADVQKRLGAVLPEHVNNELNGFALQMRHEAEEAKLRLEEFFGTVDIFLRDHVRAHSQFAQQVRLTPAARAQPGYDEIEISWDNLNRHLKAISKYFDRLVDAASEITDQFDVEAGDEMRAAILANGRALEEARANLEQTIAYPQDGMIYWVEIFKDRISLHAAPLHIGPLVEKHIFGEKETVVLTSATLRTADPGSYGEADFNYLRHRLHAYDANELAVGSPFDYKNATLLYLPTDIPEPNQPGYQAYVEQAIVDVATALGGRTMVLFTSFAQLRQTAQTVEAPLASAKINLLAQLPGSSRQQLLAQFKQEGGRSVLLGTRSFWEGVDVPGPALQALLIAKLPFDVPSDPIFAARSETFDSPFFEYSIPEAVLRLRQGFGRLVRRKSDEGVVVILDKRVLTKRYGQSFLEALPECTILRQRSDRLGELTLRWLNRERD